VPLASSSNMRSGHLDHDRGSSRWPATAAASFDTRAVVSHAAITAGTGSIRLHLAVSLLTSSHRRLQFRDQPAARAGSPGYNLSRRRPPFDRLISGHPYRCWPTVVQTASSVSLASVLSHEWGDQL